MGDKKYKVLLVDDDKFMVDMYSLKFVQGGLDVKTVFSAQEALDKIREDDSFDIIITDLIMPAMDGFELLEKIRKEKLAEKSVLIILSNQGQKSEIEKAEKFGIDGYIIKASSIPSEVLSNVVKIADRRFKNI